MSFDITIQAIGLLGFCFGLTAYLSRQDNVLKSLIGLASLAIAVHFFLLGVYVGAGAALFSSIRSFLSIFKSVKPYAPLFFAAYIPLGYFCIEDGLDVLPILAGLTGTYCMFYMEKLPMRYGLFLATFIWFVHNLMQGSIGGSLLELFYIGANLRTIMKIRKEERIISPL